MQGLIEFQREREKMSSGNNNHWWLGTEKDNQYKINTNVLIMAILCCELCVVFVVVLVLLLHVYAQLVRRRHRRHLRITALARLRTGLAPIQQPQAQPQKVGLDPSVIAAIPTITYKISTTASAPPECTVCLSTVEEGEIVRILPNCKHTFHLECIDMWLHSQSSCPICRAEVAPPQPVEDLEGGEGLGVVESCGGIASERRGSCREESSTSRLSASFRRMLNRERSTEDLERREGRKEEAILVEEKEGRKEGRKRRSSKGLNSRTSQLVCFESLQEWTCTCKVLGVNRSKFL